MKKEPPIFQSIIERIMRDNGGHASLKLLSREFPNYADMSRIKGKTPLNSLRRELQRRSAFKKIGLGVYALTDAELPIAVVPKTQKEKTAKRHSDIQGMLLEIGNNRQECADTYTPDRNDVFNSMRLGSIATIKEMPNFTYSRIIETVRYADVIWFNNRGFPSSVFEVEHSTNFRSALIKFCELQDFHTDFWCVADQSRKQKFERELESAAFAAIKSRCKFRAYEDVETAYETAITPLAI